MSKKIISAIIFCLILVSQAYSQEVGRATITYTPSENGYELEIPFSWKFINCYGEVHVTITKNSKDITSSTYIYNGVRYTATELGSDAFIKPECGLTNLSADVFHNAFKLGNIEMGNVIDWLGGCFGQTYHAIKLLGLEDADYKKHVAELSLSNLKIESLSSTDYKIESIIKDIEKKKSLSEKTTQADNAFDSGDMESAKALYEEALKIDYSSEHAKARLKEIKELLKTEKKEAEYKKALESGEELEEKGDYESAKSKYEKALSIKPDDEVAQKKLSDIEEKLNQEKTSQKNKSAAVSAATSRNHSGTFWGKNFNSDSYGSSTQAANLIGNFRLDYNMWTVAGEPAHKFKFYWEWDNSLNTGYPQWVSVLHDTVVMIEELQKYPDLMTRWNNIKPDYIELECKILYYKNGEDYVADVGILKVIPEVIGYSGKEVNWSLPTSSNWDELFTYCNGIEWGYFREIGLYEEMSEYERKYGTSITWAKYAFEYSDQINFYQDHSWFHSEFIELTDHDYENVSSTADIIKVVWPVEEIQAVIREFKNREKRKKEEKMTSEDFWNTTENEKKSADADFWSTPENDMTKTEKNEIEVHESKIKEVNESRERLTWGSNKYIALQDPFSITTPGRNATVEEGKIDFKGKIHHFLDRENAKVDVNIDDEQFYTSNSGGYFSCELILKEGWNTVMLNITADGFGFTDSVKVFYKKPPPLPCDNNTSAGGDGQTINEHGLGTTDGVFYVNYDMYSAPDELIIYQGPKERRSHSNIIYETYGKVSGSDRIRIAFSDIETGIITVEVNGSSGTSWNYLIECPE